MSVPEAPARPTVPELAFTVSGAEAERFAAVPTLRFRLAVARSGGGPVRAVHLATTVRIDVARRTYEPRVRRALAELFGEAGQWGATLRPLVWARATVLVPAFDTATTVDVPVACGGDAELAVTRYLRAVRDGEVPLDFLFNGTVFFEAAGGRLCTAQIPWSQAAEHRLPAAWWHALTDRYAAGNPWLRLSREVYDRLDAHRARQVLGSADDAVRDLLDRLDAAPPRAPVDRPTGPDRTGAGPGPDHGPQSPTTPTGAP